MRGSQAYRVQLVWDDGVPFEYECSCPYAADDVACKHVWATLLEADQRDLLPDIHVDAGPDPEPDEVDAFLTSLAGPRVHRVEPERATAAPQAWKQALRRIAQLMAARQTPAAPAGTPPGEHRLIYLVDVATTLALRQGLVVDVMTESRKRDGSWGAPRPVTVGGIQWEQLAGDDDAEIGQKLRGATQAAHDSGFGGFATTRFLLNGSAFTTTLRPICESGRCRVRVRPEDKRGVPLAWDSAAPWELQLRVAASEDGSRYGVVGLLVRDDEQLELSAPDVLLAGGLMIHDGVAARFLDRGAFDLVSELRAGAAFSAPAADARELIAELHALPHVPPITWPAQLEMESVRPRPVPNLRLRALAGDRWRPPGLTATLSFIYAGELVHAEYPASAQLAADGGRLIHRDREGEADAATRLTSLGFRVEHDYRTGMRSFVLAPARLGAAVLALTEEGWHVELDGRRYRAPGVPRVAIRSAIDWFELEGWVEFDGERATLPQLLAALARGEAAVRLDDGTLGIVPAEWLRRFAPLADAGSAAGRDGSLRFSRTQVALLDALLGALPEVTADERFAQARTELLSFDRIEPLDAPSGFQGALRPYQREGLGWLEFLRRFELGGCLADDMGLGKTVQVLALLEKRRVEGGGPSLVVAPRSIVFNWLQEATRFTPALRVLDHSGAERRKATEHFGDFELILTTYGTLRRDAVLFHDVTFDYVVLDEAQMIKNAGTASAKAARLLKARHRLALSGTPIENHLGELWSLFEFLNPGMLGSAAAFKRRYANPKAGVPDERRALLARAVRPFVLRRTKDQVARDLPEKQEQTVYVDLQPTERKLYDELRDHYRGTLLARIGRSGLARAQMHILEALLRLRQAACHPGLLDRKRVDDSSSKLDVLLPQLAEVVESGHKALVFSQFTSFLAILRARLDRDGVVYEYLDGKTRDREARVGRFQSDAACPLFLISLKAGGLGLNLTAADYVFLLDPWWNPAAEAQAIDRAHRIGQTQRVLASRLIARETVEERVLELQQTKRELADAIIGEDNSIVARIGREELERLLS